jgi:hypothetical protein
VEAARLTVGAARVAAQVLAPVIVSVLKSATREDATGGHLNVRAEGCRLHIHESQEQPNRRSDSAHIRGDAAVAVVPVRSPAAVGIAIIARVACDTLSSVASVSMVDACLSSISPAARRTACPVSSAVCTVSSAARPYLALSFTVRTVSRVAIAIESCTVETVAHRVVIVIVSIAGPGISIAASAAFGSVQGVVIDPPRIGLAQVVLTGPVVVVADVAIADPKQLLRARAIIESIVPAHEKAPWWGVHSAMLEVCMVVEGIGAVNGPAGTATGTWEWVKSLLRPFM